MEKRGVDIWTISLSRAVVTDKAGDVGVSVITRSLDCIVQQGVVLSYFVSETKNKLTSSPCHLSSEILKSLSPKTRWAADNIFTCCGDVSGH